MKKHDKINISATIKPEKKQAVYSQPTNVRARIITSVQAMSQTVPFINVDDVITINPFLKVVQF